MGELSYGGSKMNWTGASSSVPVHQMLAIFLVAFRVNILSPLSLVFLLSIDFRCLAILL